MKIISWNCNGAFRKKYQNFDDLKVDVFVIQKCENPFLSAKQFKEWAGDYLWVGQNRNKGIGIFARNGHTVEALD